MTDKETIRTSKFLSLILRHEPKRFGLKLDSADPDLHITQLFFRRRRASSAVGLLRSSPMTSPCVPTLTESRSRIP